MQDYLTKNSGAFDIEVARWWTPKPIVYMNTAVSGFGDIVDCLFPIDGTKLRSATGRVATYRCHGNGEMDDASLRTGSLKLIRATAEAIRKSPLRITQNGLSYDYPVCNKTKGVFGIGADNSGPMKTSFRRGILDFHGRQMSGDALDLDLMWFSKGYLLPFITDSKLETIAAFFDRNMECNFGFAKMHTYEEQADLFERALEGDLSAARSLGRYGYDDSIVTYQIGKRVLPVLFNIANTCKVSYFDALNESPKNVALFSSEHQQFSALHKPNIWSRPFKDDKAMNSLIKREFKKLQISSINKGLTGKVMVAYYPFSNYIKPVLLLNTIKREMMALSRETEHPVEKYMYERVLDGWCGEILADLDHAWGDDKFNRVLRGKYKGLDRIDLRQKLADGLSEKISEAFKDVTVVNRSRNMYFLQGISEKEARRRGFIVFGNADAISVGPGRIIYNLHGEICSSGIDIPSKKKAFEEPGTNEECALKINVIRNFVQDCFEDPNVAFDRVHETARALAEGQIPQKDLLMRVRKKEEPENQGEEQQDLRRGRIISTYPAEIGESIVYILSEGPAGEELYDRFNPADGTFAFPPEPALQIYENEIFGIKPTGHDYESGDDRTSTSEAALFSIAKAILMGNSRSSSENKQTLEQLLRGRLDGPQRKEFIRARLELR